MRAGRLLCSGVWVPVGIAWKGVACRYDNSVKSEVITIELGYDVMKGNIMCRYNSVDQCDLKLQVEHDNRS